MEKTLHVKRRLFFQKKKIVLTSFVNEEGKNTAYLIQKYFKTSVNSLLQNS